MSTYGEDENVGIANFVARVKEDEILSRIDSARSEEPEMAQVTQASGETVTTRSSLLQRFCRDSCDLGGNSKKGESGVEELGEHDNKLL